MSAHERVTTGAGLVFAGTALGMGLGMLTRVLAARLLGPADYGVLVLGVTLLNALAIAGALGMRKTLARNLPLAADPAGTFATGTAVAVSVAVVVAGLAAAFADRLGRAFFGPETVPVLLVAALGVPFLVLLEVAVGAFQGAGDPVGKVAVQDLARRGAVAVLVVGGILLGYGTLGAAAGWALGIAISAVLALLLLRRRTGLLARRAGGSPLDRDLAVSLVSFSIPIVAADSVWRLLQEVDNLFLGVYRTSEALGAYDAAFTVSRGVLLFLWSFQFLFLPVLTELHGRGDREEMRRLYGLTTKWIAVSALPAVVLLAVFRRPILAGVFGPDYASAHLALLVLVVGFFAYVTTGLGRPALTAVGDLRPIVVGTTLALGGNVALNALLVPPLGAEGAALATAVSFGGLNLVYGVALFHRTGIHPLTGALVRTLGVSLVAVSAVGILLRTALPAGLGGVLLAGAILYAAEAIVFVAVGLEDADVELLTSAVRRLGGAATDAHDDE